MRISDWRSDVCSSDLIVAGMRQEPANTLWREGGYGLLVYESEEQVRALDPDFRMLRDMGNILIIATAPGDKTDIVSRVFAPGAGKIGRASCRERVCQAE